MEHAVHDAQGQGHFAADVVQIERNGKVRNLHPHAMGIGHPEAEVHVEGNASRQPGQLQALGFAVQELGLYLDTHGDDAEAAELFHRYTELYESGMAQYQENCGPLFQKQAYQDGAYTWNNTPWPWEYRANKED